MDAVNVEAADLDADGDADLLFDSSALAVGVALFEEGVPTEFTFFADAQGDSLAVDDFSGDGLPDLFASGMVYPSVAVGQWGEGIEVCSPPSVLLGSGDTNGDGAADLLCASGTALHSMNAAPASLGGLVTAGGIFDVNGDGIDDVIVATPIEVTVHFGRAGAALGFSSSAVSSIDVGNLRFGAVAPLRNGGVLTHIALHQTDEDGIRVVPIAPDGSIADAAMTDFGGGRIDASGDIDGDGADELLILREVVVALSVVEGALTSRRLGLVRSPSGLSLVRADGGGAPELVVSGGSGTYVFADAARGTVDPAATLEVHRQGTHESAVALDGSPVSIRTLASGDVAVVRSDESRDVVLMGQADVRKIAVVDVDSVPPSEIFLASDEGLHALDLSTTPPSTSLLAAGDFSTVVGGSVGPDDARIFTLAGDELIAFSVTAAGALSEVGRSSVALSVLYGAADLDGDSAVEAVGASDSAIATFAADGSLLGSTPSFFGSGSGGFLCDVDADGSVELLTPHATYADLTSLPAGTFRGGSLSALSPLSLSAGDCRFATNTGDLVIQITPEALSPSGVRVLSARVTLNAFDPTTAAPADLGPSMTLHDGLAWSVVAADLDGDATPELVFGSMPTFDDEPSASLRTFRRDGSATSALPLVVPGFDMWPPLRRLRGAGGDAVLFSTEHASEETCTVLVSAGVDPGTARPTPIRCSRGLHAVVAGDLDGDGWDEVIDAERSSGPVRIFRGSAGWALDEVIEVDVEVSWAKPLPPADFDGDGWADLLMLTDDRAVLLSRFGTAPAAEAIELPLVFARYGSAADAVGDFDGDGDPDVALLLQGPGDVEESAALTVWWNDGGVLEHIPGRSDVTGSLFSYFADLHPFDVDGDGDDDLLVSGNSLTLFESRGGSLGFRSSLPLGGWGDGVAVLDATDDGQVDLVTPLGVVLHGSCASAP